MYECPPLDGYNNIRSPERRKPLSQLTRDDILVLFYRTQERNQQLVHDQTNLKDMYEAIRHRAEVANILNIIFNIMDYG